MEDRLEQLFEEWNDWGAAVLVAAHGPSVSHRRAEDLIAESTARCRESGRLTWVVLDWLMRHIDEIDEKRLFDQTRSFGDLAVLGLLCDAAHDRHPHSKFGSIVRRCAPNPELTPFFRRVEKSPLALQLTCENPLEIFRRWNYLSRELRYLEDDLGSTIETSQGRVGNRPSQ
jgi:hypothetical protein